MFFFSAKEYLRYQFLSGYRKGHGIHSPFIYDVVSRVFRNKTDKAIVSKVENIRKELLNDRRMISVNDLGSGSVKSSQRERTRRVSDIARYSSVSQKYGILLSNLACEFGGPGIIELGTSLGISSIYMALSCPESTIHTIEGCKETIKIAEENIGKAMANNIILHCGSFDDCLPEVLDKNNAPGLVFIDGNHRREPVLKYFDMIARNSSSRTIVVIDDINLSAEMKDTWHIIMNHKKVSVTLDVYRFGIVFFREGINRSHFIIRH